MADLHIERVVVTGGRRFTDAARIEADLRALLPLGLRRAAQGGNGIHEQFGGAEWPEAPRSADALAWLATSALRLEAATYRPNRRLDGTWRLDQPDGTGKGQFPRRNIRMLEAERPDIVLAYPDPKSRGTWHCVREALKRGIAVVVWDSSPPSPKAQWSAAFAEHKGAISLPNGTPTRHWIFAKSSEAALSIREVFRGSRALRLALTAASTGLVLAGVGCFVAAAWLGQQAERRSR